jgi:hypothetical protein
MSAPTSPITAMLVWNGIKIMVTHTPGYFNLPHGQLDHIELHTENDTPLPVTKTGYRSHFVFEQQLEPYGSALAYVQTWLDHEAQCPAWQRTFAASKQLRLF